MDRVSTTSRVAVLALGVIVHLHVMRYLDSLVPVVVFTRVALLNVSRASCHVFLQIDLSKEKLSIEEIWTG